MKRLGMLMLLSALCVGAEGQCNACDATRATKCQEYSGNVAAVEPYDATPIVTVDRHNDEWGTVLAHVWLHNPTGVDVLADITCAFYLDDWHAGDNTIRDVTVCAERSVEAELQWGGDFLESAEAGVTCDTTWH